MRGLLKEIKEWRHGYSKYIAYSYHFTVWLYINRWRRLRRSLKNHWGVIKRAIIVTLALFAGFMANYFGAATLSQSIFSNYLVAVGVMIGGTTAIIFSISIFLLQGVADLYSSKHFSEFTNSWVDQVTYIVIILIAITMLGAGVFVGETKYVTGLCNFWIVICSLGLIGLVFGLIDWQYELVRKKISPVNGILFLEKKGMRFLKEMEYNASKVANLLAEKQGKAPNDIALATAYNYVLQPFINDLNGQIETLVEISMKLSDRQEIQTTKQGFTAVSNLLAEFLNARQTSSLAIPSGPLFLAIQSDSQDFLANNFERLNKAGEKFITEGKDDSATHVIYIYNSLASKAKDMTFIGQSINDNPIINSIVSYLNAFVENGKRLKNIEVVYQGARILGNVALICADKGFDSTLHGIQDDLQAIAVFGLTEKNTVIVDDCVSSYLNIIEAVFASKKIVARYQFDSALNDIAKIAGNAHILMNNGYLPDNFITRISSSKGYDEMYTVLVKIVDYYFTLTATREKRSYRDNLTNLVEKIYSSLRWLSENIKDCDSILIGSIGRLLFDINALVIKLYQNSEFTDQQKDFAIRLGWNIHLPSWFAYHADKFDGGSNAFDTLADSVAKTGILIAEELGNRELVINCVETLGSMADQCLDKSTNNYGYDEIRVLEKACYLGILALKKGWRDVLDAVGLKIYEFEPKYFDKYLTNLPAGVDPENHRIGGIPHRDELLRMLFAWRENFMQEKLSGSMRILDNAEAMMYSLIDPIDIDRFTFEIWHEFLSPNDELEAEIELKFARRALTETIRKIGTLRSQKGVADRNIGKI